MSEQLFKKGDSVLVIAAPGWAIGGTISSLSEAEINLNDAVYIEAPNSEKCIFDTAKDPKNVGQAWYTGKHTIKQAAVIMILQANHDWRKWKPEARAVASV